MNSSRYITECGKACLEQAKKYGLRDYYDPFSGVYAIPDSVYEYDPNVLYKAQKLLKEGVCYDAEGKVINSGKLCMTIDKSYDNSVGEFIYCIFELPDEG